MTRTLARALLTVTAVSIATTTMAGHASGLWGGALLAVVLGGWLLVEALAGRAP